MNTDLARYYAERAAEYEQIYEKPERQLDLRVLESQLSGLFSQRDVLEIACGTGYWTQRIAETARSIFATDINDEVLAIAEAKTYGCPTIFRQLDLFDLPENPGRRFGALCAGFIWSHIPKEKLPLFVQKLAAQVLPGGRLIFFDNRFIEGGSTPVFSTDENGNTYQRRFLKDGSEHLVLKNFPDETELSGWLSAYGSLEIRELSYFWTVALTLR